MKQELVHAGSVPARLSLYLRDEMRKAKHELRPSRQDAATRVHEARKSIKKLRAGLRLAKKLFPKAARQKIESALRTAAHLLGPLRDSEVLRKTAARLHKGGEALPEVDSSSSSSVPLRQARGKLKEAAAALRDLPRSAVESKAWKAGLKRLYRRGRNAMRQAEASGTDEDLHTWRRRTKDFLYALGLLRGNEIPGGAATLKKTDRLAEKLGDDHDLAFFGQKFSSSEDGHKFKPLFDRAKKHRRRFQKKAFRLGHEIFGPKPEKFASELDGN